MVNRDDMLELTRRMTPARTCFDRIAGGYMDRDGYLDDSFNIHFLKLSQNETKEKLLLAKKIPFAKENEELKEYSFSEGNKEQRVIYQILNGIRESGLKNDAVLENLYEIIGQHYESNGDYAIYIFHGSYDVPVKAADKEWLEGSEEVYDFIICTICPLIKEYEAGDPEFGFLFPFFSDRSSDMEHIGVFQNLQKEKQKEIFENVLFITEQTV